MSNSPDGCLACNSEEVGKHLIANGVNPKTLEQVTSLSESNVPIVEQCLNTSR